MSTITQLTIVTAPAEKNRRAHSRRRPQKLAYLRFDNDNGGILLDISEGGLNFQGVAGLIEGEPCRLEFMLPGAKHRIESAGQVVWANSSKKGGGLRFVHLPEAARRQIEEWIAEESPVAAAAEFLPLGPGRASQRDAVEEKRSSQSLSRAQLPPKSVGWRRTEQDNRSGRDWRAISLTVAAVLIFGFAAAVLLGNLPFDKLVALFDGKGKGVGMQRAALPTTAAPQNFQVEVVDINDRRWTLANPSDESVPAEQGTQLRESNFQNAVLIHGVRAQYPPGVSDARVNGAVRVNATIGKDGVPGLLSVLSGDSRLSPAALAAIHLWRYRPALLDGKPIESQMVIIIDF